MANRRNPNPPAKSDPPVAEVEETPEIVEDSDTDELPDVEIDSDAIKALAQSRSIHIEGEFVNIGGKILFPLGNEFARLLIWNPTRVGNLIEGEYLGKFVYTWEVDGKEQPEEYHWVRSAKGKGRDYLLPQWQMIDSQMEKILSQADIPAKPAISILYMGTKGSKKGMEYNIVLIGMAVT